MRRRNGAGSRQLVDATEKLRRGQIQLIGILEEEKLITPKEASTLSGQVERAAAQKRSSDVLGAALALNRKIMRVLRHESLSEVTRQDSELEILFEVSRMIQSTRTKEEVYGKLLELIHQAIPHDNATLFLCDRQTGKLAAAAQRGGFVDLIGGVS
ncbi:MAG: hypothetical protein KAY24_12010, partial [Candidatus Eisenbacteria sp.]|nr:hypothetical protein [Candidatus Eisenbacteria bacterium]